MFSQVKHNDKVKLKFSTPKQGASGSPKRPLNLQNSIPLAVDLDGTLIKTDLLLETASEHLVRYPLRSFRMLAWALSGRATLKERLATACPVDAATLPYHHAVVEWLKEQRASGVELVLATASDRAQAQAVADHLGLFSDVLASDGAVNLKAKAKRDALVARYGERGFDYVGNSGADLPVWGAARQCHVVGAAPRFAAKVAAIGKLGQVFASAGTAPLHSALRALRLHQWVKNLLVFIPLLAAHQYTNFSSVALAALAFVAFGLTASSVYLFNDLADLAHDRRHPRKKNRPLAAGDLSLPAGWLLSVGLVVAGLALAYAALPAAFVGYLVGYFTLSNAYSLLLKRVAALDVLVLAGLYTMRIIAGAAAVSVLLSFWLLTFSLFMFLSLAYIKRYCEASASTSQLPGRGYQRDDLTVISTLGVAAGYIAVLVLALYIQASTTAELYQDPQLIWLACPLLLYWISRAWIIVHRDQMHDDPIVFALKDPVSWVVGALFVAVFAVARYAL